MTQRYTLSIDSSEFLSAKSISLNRSIGHCLLKLPQIVHAQFIQMSLHNYAYKGHQPAIENNIPEAFPYAPLAPKVYNNKILSVPIHTMMGPNEIQVKTRIPVPGLGS